MFDDLGFEIFGYVCDQYVIDPIEEGMKQKYFD